MDFKDKIDGRMNLCMLVFGGQPLGFRRKHVAFKHCH